MPLTLTGAAMRRVISQRVGRFVRRHRALIVLSLLGACERGMATTVRVVVVPAVAGDTSQAARRAAHTAAVRAVDRLALHSGLAPHRNPGRCTRAWTLSYHARTDAGRGHGTLHACAVVSSDDVLEVHLREGPSGDWSAKGDSLRRALADTLVRYGRLVPP